MACLNALIIIQNEKMESRFIGFFQSAVLCLLREMTKMPQALKYIFFLRPQILLLKSKLPLRKIANRHVVLLSSRGEVCLHMCVSICITVIGM